jgi:hypothetical protein
MMIEQLSLEILFSCRERAVTDNLIGGPIESEILSLRMLCHFIIIEEYIYIRLTKVISRVNLVYWFVYSSKVA